MLKDFNSHEIWQPKNFKKDVLKLNYGMIKWHFFRYIVLDIQSIN
jgi:hypothetical protein